MHNVETQQKRTALRKYHTRAQRRQKLASRLYQSRYGMGRLMCVLSDDEFSDRFCECLEQASVMLDNVAEQWI